MRIAIDARFLGPDGTGIGRYTEELLRELEKIDKINEYHILLRSSNFDTFKPTNPNFHRVLADVHWYTAREQVIIPRILRRINPDLTHFPYDAPPILSPGKVIITIHDLIKTDFFDVSSSTKSKATYLVKQSAYKLALKKGAKRAVKIIVPTNAIKHKVINDLNILNNKIAVTYESSDQKFFTWGETKLPISKVNEILKKYLIHQPFLIYVGNMYPYKNLTSLVDALTLLPKELSLLCAGKRTPFHERVVWYAKEKKVGNRVVMPGFIPDEDIAVLYQAAEMYVFPTLSEGFGLPAIEAMASQLPVTCSDIPVLREVCGDNALFFDPKDPKDIATKIFRIHEDKKLREKLIREGLERAKQFSWRKMAAQTLLVYEEAVK